MTPAPLFHGREGRTGKGEEIGKAEKGQRKKQKYAYSGDRKKLNEEVIDTASLGIETRDLFPAEKSLLEAVEPYLVTTTVTCPLQAADSG